MHRTFPFLLSAALISIPTLAIGAPSESDEYAAEYSKAVTALPPSPMATTAGTPRSRDTIPLSVDASLAFNPITSLISDNGGTGSRVTLTPAVLLSAELRPGFEFFLGTQYSSHGVPVMVAGKEVLASNSVLEFPLGVAFPMRGTFLGDDTLAVFRTGISLNLPLSDLGYGNQVIAASKFAYSTYLETGALFPVDRDIMVGATMRLGIGLSNAYERNSAGVERTFVYGFAASSRFTL